MNIKELCEAWLEFKADEERAKAGRRELEDHLIGLEHITNINVMGEYQIEITPQARFEINANALNQLAQENGLEDHLNTLFRWIPKLNLKVWKAADKSITDPLLGAFKTTDKRPSFKITRKDSLLPDPVPRSES